MFFAKPVDPRRPLSLADLTDRVNVHNNVQRLLGCFLAAGSAFLWIVSFFALTYLFALILAWTGIPFLYAFLPALAGLAALVWYAVRNAAGIVRHEGDWTVDKLGQSGFVPSYRMGLLGARMAGAAMAMGFFIDVLLCAPRTSVLAIHAFKSCVAVDGVVIQQAHAIRQQLFENRARLQNWTPLSDFLDWPHAMVLLVRLKLIVIDEKDQMVRLQS